MTIYASQRNRTFLADQNEKAHQVLLCPADHAFSLDFKRAFKSLVEFCMITNRVVEMFHQSNEMRVMP